MDENFTPSMDDMIECVCGEGAQGYTREELDRFVRHVQATAVRDLIESLYGDNEFVWTQKRGLVIREDEADRHGVTLYEYLNARADAIEEESHA